MTTVDTTPAPGRSPASRGRFDARHGWRSGWKTDRPRPGTRSEATRSGREGTARPHAP